MEEKLKYRLVGAAVILALMAFFLPLILDSKKYKTEIVSQIPPMPSASLSTDNAADQNSDKGASAVEAKAEPLVINLDSPMEEQTAPTENIELKQAESVNSDLSSKEADKALNDIDTKIPNEDVASSKEIKTPVKENIQKEQKKITEAVKTAEVKAEQKAQEVESKIESANTSAKPDFKESAYVIQIGSFSNKENATKLVNDLRKQDYRAYQRVSDNFSRVYVGPYPEMAIAESRSSKLAQIVGNSVKIIEFDPIKH